MFSKIKTYTFMKLKKRGRLKRKIKKRIINVNNLVD